MFLKLKATFALLLAFLFLAAAPAAALEPLTVTSNAKSIFDGFNYELWRQSEGDVSMTLTGGGTFRCSWEKVDNVLFRTGKLLGSKSTADELGAISIDYSADYQPKGNSYLCVYGWSVDPLVEFYVVDSWGSWRPPGGVKKGSVDLDGGTYEIYETTRTQQPSIQGTQTFEQYWSVRTEKNDRGTISVSEHFKAWEALGMKLGKMYEVTICVEGYQSSGTADVNQFSLTIGGETYGADANLPPKTGDASTPLLFLFTGFGALAAGAGLAVFHRKKSKSRRPAR
ncbi:MAG: glycoside hydrolase family 11 protein [Firmicutes bacterium]|nr:glycoside hydrolase family 11 protein [Bacillota bacterium]